jgi:hypothetical protein
VRVFALVRLPVAVEWVRLRGHAPFPLARLGLFRAELDACFTRRADALFKLGDALLCAQAVPSLLGDLGLALQPGKPQRPVHRRHGLPAGQPLLRERITW